MIQCRLVKKLKENILATNARIVIIIQYQFEFPQMREFIRAFVEIYDFNCKKMHSCIHG